MRINLIRVFFLHGDIFFDILQSSVNLGYNGIFYRYFMNCYKFLNTKKFVKFTLRYFIELFCIFYLKMPIFSWFTELFGKIFNRKCSPCYTRNVTWIAKGRARLFRSVVFFFLPDLSRSLAWWLSTLFFFFFFLFINHCCCIYFRCC